MNEGPQNSPFELTPEDLESRKAFAEILEIMERRQIAGETQTSDYAEAVARHQLETRMGREIRKIENVNLVDQSDAIFFDWDGVLYDSMRRVCLGAHKQILLSGHPRFNELTEEEVFNSYSSPFWDYYRRFGIPVDTEADRNAVFDYYHKVIYPELDKQLPNKDTLFPEVEGTLIWLNEEVRKQKPGLRLGIISAGNKERIIAVLEEKGLQQIFDFVSGSQHDKANSIKDACAMSGVPVNRIMFLGDLPSDIKDAQNSATGIQTVAVARSANAETRLETYNPDYLIQGIAQENFLNARRYIY